MEVKFLNLDIPTEQIKGKYLEAVEKILDKGNFILTEEVENFEHAWAGTIGTKYAIGVSSGADALYLALRALDIGEGDEVITQGNAYNASVTAILRVGAVPRFADIDEGSLRLDVGKMEPLINKKTKAILPVHLFGQPNDMEAVKKLAQKYKLKIIEDCAQAHLAKFNGRSVGAWGDVAAFSFYPTKNLGAFGDAGAVTTDNEEIYKKIIALRNLGQTAKNKHDYLGFNMRLDPFQAECLRLKLSFLEENTKARQAAGEYYDKLIKESGLSIAPVVRDPRASHVYHLYVARFLANNRDDVQKELTKMGVQTAVHYPTPVYRQPFYQGPVDPCPVSDATSGQVLSLPLYVGIIKEQQEYVIDCLKKILG